MLFRPIKNPWDRRCAHPGARSVVWFGWVSLVVAVSAGAGAPSSEDLEFFEAKIRPVLVKHCYQCHSAEAKSLKGGLRLDSAPAMRQGGEGGPA
ncbi:c-type cytochrome domain-containing protein, partial [Singulisphaera rosea]